MYLFIQHKRKNASRFRQGGKVKRVLIIEDDMDAANVLEAYLKRDQFQTSIAANGQRGLELVFSWKPDIILLDVMLPLLSGTDVLLAVRRRSDVPVIMITLLEMAATKSVPYASGPMTTSLNPIIPVKWWHVCMLY